MIIQNVNRNKFHTELQSQGIETVTVLAIDESPIGAEIIFPEGTDMALVQQVIDSHDLTPLPKEPTENEMIILAIADLDAQRENDKLENQLAIAELAETMLGGTV